MHLLLLLFVCFLHPVLFFNFYFLNKAERTVQQLLASQAFVGPDCFGAVGGGFGERTSKDQWPRMQPAGYREKKSCAGPAASSFTSLFSLPVAPPFETVRLSQVDFSVEAGEAGPVRLPPRLFNVYDLQHIIAPTHTSRPHPLLSVKERKTDTFMHLVPVSQLWNLWVSKRAEEKCMSVCRNNLFFNCFLDFSLFHKKQKKRKQGKKKSKLNVVEMFQNHPGNRCCSTLIRHLACCSADCGHSRCLPFCSHRGSSATRSLLRAGK